MSATRIIAAIKDDPIRWRLLGDVRDLGLPDCTLYFDGGCQTATAVAVRRMDNDACELIAPHGVDDLLGLKLRPAGAFVDRKRAVFDGRGREKRWLQEFPKLELID